MIAALRRRHARTWAAWAVLLPALLLFALHVRAGRARDELPRLASVAEALPSPADAALGGESALAAPPPLWSTDDLWPGLHVSARVQATRDGALVLALQLTEPLLQPDLLVRFVPAPDATTGDAAPAPPVPRLLGALASSGTRRFALPADARQGGTLSLYSLAHDATLAQAALPPLGAAGKSAR